MKTIKEIKALKYSWLNDPDFIIEETKGFEDHYEELRKFREQNEVSLCAKYINDINDITKESGTELKRTSEVSR